MRGVNFSRNRKLDGVISALFSAYRASNESAGLPPSPHLHRRIIARIEAEKRRLTEEAGTWGTLFREARNVIPVLTLITVFAMWLVIYSPTIDQALTQSSLAHPPQVLVATEIPPFSNDEMMVGTVRIEDRNK